MSVHKREPVARPVSNNLICRRRVIFKIASTATSIMTICDLFWGLLASGSCPFRGMPRTRNLGRGISGALSNQGATTANRQYEKCGSSQTSSYSS